MEVVVVMVVVVLSGGVKLVQFRKMRAASVAARGGFLALRVR